MASKITGLPADTAPTTDDLVVTVNDPSGTPANKKVTIADLLNVQAGRLIAVISYNPATETDKTSTSTTGADVDATNLAITFTAPASGNVLVSLTAVCYQSGSNYYLWGLRDGGGNITGTFGLVDGNTTIQSRRTHRIYKTGLTPGTSYTWKWAFMVDTGTMHVQYGDDGSFPGRNGPALMEVWSAP